MAKKTPAEEWADWLRKHPNADTKRQEKYLKRHGDIAFMLGQQQSIADLASTPAATPPAAAPSESPAPGIDHADPAPTAPAPAATAQATTPDNRTALQKVWDWFKNNPIEVSYPVEGPNITAWINQGIWCVAVAGLLWLFLRKKKRT